MVYKKKRLLAIAQKIKEKERISPDELSYLLSFEKVAKNNFIISMLKRASIPLALALGFSIFAFPTYFENMVATFPSWTNLPVWMLQGVDYLWGFIGEPIGKPNIFYHIPNIIFYSIGIVGAKKIIDRIGKHNWLDQVMNSQKILQEQVSNGLLNFRMKKGHSLLFIGKGDFIGAEYTLTHKPEETVSISQSKPLYTHIWSFYNVETLYEDLKTVILRSHGDTAGEYVFFPVKDDQIFLPGERAYDLSPHKLDLLCQNIRTIEKEQKWKTKRILIIGDKFHKSFVQSEDKKRIVAKSGDTISLSSISSKYTNITVIDPSDVVIKKIITIAKGRKIVFRATKEGIAEYKKRFYERLQALRYKELKTRKGSLTIGYDLFEDQTEQQTLSRKVDDYYPVVLSKNVHDALLRNGYKKDEFLYVPDLVLEALSLETARQ